jgi:hypothetical protein
LQIINWDLEQNIEHSIIRVKNKQEVPNIFKSFNENLNYFIPSESENIYDLRYFFPLNFLSGSHASTPTNKASINTMSELRLSSN